MESFIGLFTPSPINTENSPDRRPKRADKAGWSGN
jgi:hypothetical protein